MKFLESSFALDQILHKKVTATGTGKCFISWSSLVSRAWGTWIGTVSKQTGFPHHQHLLLNQYSQRETKAALLSALTVMLSTGCIRAVMGRRAHCCPSQNGWGGLREGIDCIFPLRADWAWDLIAHWRCRCPLLEERHSPNISNCEESWDPEGINLPAKYPAETNCLHVYSAIPAPCYRGIIGGNRWQQEVPSFRANLAKINAFAYSEMLTSFWIKKEKKETSPSSPSLHRGDAPKASVRKGSGGYSKRWRRGHPAWKHEWIFCQTSEKAWLESWAETTLPPNAYINSIREKKEWLPSPFDTAHPVSVFVIKTHSKLITFPMPCSWPKCNSNPSLGYQNTWKSTASF